MLGVTNSMAEVLRPAARTAFLARLKDYPITYWVSRHIAGAPGLRQASKRADMIFATPPACAPCALQVVLRQHNVSGVLPGCLDIPTLTVQSGQG